jgi:hypothetical protein
MSIGHTRTNAYALEKRARIGHTIAHEFLGFSTVYTSLSGPLSLLREP